MNALWTEMPYKNDLMIDFLVFPRLFSNKHFHAPRKAFATLSLDFEFEFFINFPHPDFHITVPLPS